MKETGKRRSRFLLLAAMVLALVLPCFAGAAEVSVKLNKSKATIYTSGSKTVQLKATVTGTKKTVKWTSSKPAVATVSQKGKVTAKKAGTTTITAKVNGQTATCKIKVIKPTIELNKSKATIYTAGTKTVQLKATVVGKSSTVKWTSSNKSVATVSAKGKVTAKKAGTTTITAKANGVTAKCKVTVKKKTVTQVKLNTAYTASRESYKLLGQTKAGKTVWTFATGKSYIAAQVSNIVFGTYKEYVYVLENYYFYKLDKETGKVVKKTAVSVPGSCCIYIDTDGTLYAVPFLGDDVIYVISSNGVLRKTIAFDSQGNGGASISGKSGNYLKVYLEFGDKTIYVPIS